MPDDVRTFGYRAFLSCCHRDRLAAWWWRRRLERFSIDPDLIGRRTPIGPVPPGLRPIFHDRQDFPAGGDLGLLTRDALEQSAALILLASPAAALSENVNEEVRQFRHHHPDRPVVAIIVKDRPYDPAREGIRVSPICLANVYTFAL